MGWQEDLDKKSIELNLKGGDNGHSISCNNSIGRDNNRGSRDVHRVSIHKEIINVVKKEETLMITKDAALEDLDKVNPDASVGKVIIEVSRILIKILATIRSNQLLTEEDKVKIRAARKERDSVAKDKQ